MDEGGRPPGTGPVARRSHPPMAAALFGDLACVSCGYNLRGLSIRESCPECGVAVRATILAVVDPRAEELATIGRPRLVAGMVLLWAWSGFLASLMVWGMRLGDVVGIWQPVAWPMAGLAAAAVVLTVASGVGSLVLVRPHARVPWRGVLRALLGAAGYVPLAALTAAIHLRHDPVFGSPLAFTGDELDTQRSLLRLGTWVCIAGIMLGLRRAFSGLLYRSYVMRTGRVPTQPMSAVLASVVIAALGDVIVLGTAPFPGMPRDIAASLDLVLVAVGGFLLTVGLGGLSVDAWRVRRAIVRPPVALASLFEPDDGAGAHAERGP